MRQVVYKTLFWLTSVTAALGGCSGSEGANQASGGSGGSAATGGGPACTPIAASEAVCGDAVDQDCDGRIDCLDSECEGQACNDAGGTCLAGGCVKAADQLPPLPPLRNVQLTVRGDSALIEFAGFDDARDYRVYPLPAKEDVLTGQNGELVVKNAIYRCGGDRQYTDRDPDGIAQDLFYFYSRSEAEAKLGFVYLEPKPGRVPVYRLADPTGERGTSAYKDSRRAEYTASEAERGSLLAAGYRDDGIAFYVPEPGAPGTQTVYRWRSTPQGCCQYRQIHVHMLDGKMKNELSKSDATEAFGERFAVLATQEPESVELTSVLQDDHDTLAAGKAHLDRVLTQGNQPVWFVQWPGLSEKTTLVVEALDQGCPWPGGYIGPEHVDGDPPIITLDEGRLTSGEVFINGQHDPDNRPKPIARAYVDATPEPAPQMDWFEGFEVGKAWPKLEKNSENNGFFYMRNANWIADFTWCTERFTIGPMLGQLVTGQGDWGGGCHLRITPRNVDANIGAGNYLHVRMDADIPSTGRRYPQILITDVANAELGTIQEPNTTPLQERLADGHAIVVQPFGLLQTGPNNTLDLQLEFCENFHWNVNAQCPTADILENPVTDGYFPVPTLGEISGFDRTVQFDVFASTERVYVYVEGKPAGCGILPPGKMPAGPVTVAYGAVIYHSGIDESASSADAPQQYLYRYSKVHTQRHFDNLGISQGVALPGWDESVLPCSSDWYDR